MGDYFSSYYGTNRNHMHAVGYISGSSVLWVGPGCPAYAAAGVANANCTFGPSIVGEAGGTGSPIVKAVDGLRLTSSGTLYGVGFNPVQGVSNLWAGNLIQQGTTVLNGFPGGANTGVLPTLSAGQTVRAAGGQCVITSQPLFACFGNSASPRL